MYKKKISKMCIIINTIDMKYLPILWKNLRYIHIFNKESSYFNVYVVILVIKNLELLNKLNNFIIENNYSYFVKIKYINNSINLSKGRNLGIKLCENTDIIAFIDDDVLINKSWISRVFKIFNTYKGIMSLTGRNEPMAIKFDIGYIPREFYWLLGCSYYKEEAKGFVKNLIGSNMILKKEVFDNIGYFNEKLGFFRSKYDKIYIGGEDTELSYRIRRKYGERSIFYDGELISYHVLLPNKVRIINLLKRAYYYPLSYVLLQLLIGTKKKKLLNDYHRIFLLKILRIFLMFKNITTILFLVSVLFMLLLGYFQTFIITFKTKLHIHTSYSKF